ELEGALVTADAMHCQVAHATFLVRKKKADFLFTVKPISDSNRGRSLVSRPSPATLPHVVTRPEAWMACQAPLPAGR
ncbi:MAG: hypothetical protein EBR10_11080, partial [Planctomycetes bacterium]|nr:hypothetical protein [Planctomycetota bacterium]